MSGQEHAATAASTGAMRKKRSASFSHEQERVRVKTKPNLLPGCTISSARSATVLTAEARIYNDASGTTASTNVVAHGNGSSAVLNSSTKSSIDEKINIIRHGRSVIVKFLQREEKERNEGKWVETMSGEKMEDLERIIIQQRSLIQQLMRERKKRSGAQFAAPNNLADAAHDQPATDQDDKPTTNQSVKPTAEIEKYNSNKILDSKTFLQLLTSDQEGQQLTRMAFDIAFSYLVELTKKRSKCNNWNIFPKERMNKIRLSVLSNDSSGLDEKDKAYIRCSLKGFVCTIEDQKLVLKNKDGQIHLDETELFDALHGVYICMLRSQNNGVVSVNHKRILTEVKKSYNNITEAIVRIFAHACLFLCIHHGYSPAHVAGVSLPNGWKEMWIERKAKGAPFEKHEIVGWFLKYGLGA